MNDPHLVVFDGYNLLHRARSGFTSGDYSIVFNFFRALRAEVERHQPTRAIMVLEGSPRRQLALDTEYKGNRKIEPGSKKEKQYVDFLRQKEIILGLMRNSFPLNIMRHPDFEADDTIHNIVKNSSRAIPVTVVSTDTDFIQLFDYFTNVKLYDPVSKKYEIQPPHLYVEWKALRGDSSDNIMGLPGVGDKTAANLMNDKSVLNKFLAEKPERLEQWTKNCEMIRFKDFTQDELMQVTSIVGKPSWDLVKTAFEAFRFKSIVNDKSWKKFVDTFNHLF